MVPASSSEVGVDRDRVVEPHPRRRRQATARMIRLSAALERSPAATADRPAARARARTVAACRSSRERRTLRLERASPSPSRTMGHPTTSTGSDSSRAMRRTTASCWKSFSPK